MPGSEKKGKAPVNGFGNARLLKEQMYQMLRVYGSPKNKDASFSEKYAEYQASSKAIKSLQKSMQAHLELTRRHAASAAALAVELAAFHHETTGARATVAFGQLHAEVERIQLASVEQLYEEEVQGATELVLWKYPDVQESMKQRKLCKLNYDSRKRKYEDKKAQLENLRANGSVPKKNLLGRKKKSESQLVEELEQRKMKLDQAEKELIRINHWLEVQFDEMHEKRKSGQVLEGPVSALFACQLHMLNKSAKGLEKIKSLFPSAGAFAATLRRYDEDLIKGMERENSLYNKKSMVFGNPVVSSTPPLVCDCITYLQINALEEVGIFRVPGEQDKVQVLKSEYDQGKAGVLMDHTVSIHDVCTLLKMYFRKLPEPLIPQEQFQKLLTIMRVDVDGGGTNTADNLIEIANSIPGPNKELVGYLFRFLHQVTEHSESNQMNAQNLATCFAPSITRPAADTPVANILADMHPTIMGIKILIENANKLSSPALEQIRKNTTLKRSAPMVSSEIKTTGVVSGAGFKEMHL